jgi:ABC-type multidrug transport system ATPase subunit/pSer/pThr/pTyr-binding forkhead associated (FHA) protein/ABC-type multidrug transport system permease subunit
VSDEDGVPDDEPVSDWEEPDPRLRPARRHPAPLERLVIPVLDDEEDLTGESGSQASLSRASLSQALVSGSGPDADRTTEMSLATGIWRVFGSGLDADIQVSSLRVSARGVRIRRVGHLVEIQKLADDVVVLVDGEPREGRVAVSLEGHSVLIDGVPLTEGMIPNDVLEADELPEFFAPITIGRAPDCDFVLEDPVVSARHVRLVREPQGLRLEDLDSANGTYVNEQRIKRATIGWRAPFEVGSVRLTPLDVVMAVRGRRASNQTSVIGVVSEDETASTTGTLPPNLLVQAAAGLQAPTTNRVPTMSHMGLPGTQTTVGDLLRPGATLIVGRDAAADIVIDTPNVSRQHARIEVTEEGYLVTDLGSTNGTWLNGERILGAVAVQAGDDLRVGPHRLRLEAGGRIDSAEAGAGGVGGVRLDVHKLVREVGAGLRVVDEVSFSILPGEMVAIMGPSGAGKTSVLTAVAGYTPPTSGHVLIDGLSLYKHYDVFRQAVGYVPQEDVMHRSLTVEEVLTFHARINFPDALTTEEVRERVDTVLRQLDLDRVRGSLVGDEVRRGLSGGQRKRLNVAIELLGQPSLLLLDEPTSGLDARSAMQLIRQCRGLASGGRTVVMTIHQPRREAFDLFDKILLLTTGGKVAYFGPVTGVKRYFSERSDVPPESARNPADYVLDVLDPLDPSLARDPVGWQADYRDSPQHTRFVSTRLRKDQLQLARKGSRLGASVRANPFRQAWNLTLRYARLKWRDRNALAVQMAQAPVIAAIAVLLFRGGRFDPRFLKDDITPTLFVIIAASVWFGCSNVAREIVGERAIFRRERMGSLRPGPYVVSKLLLQGALIAVQVLLLLGILIPVVPLQGSVVGLVGVSLVAGWSSMAMGLLLSAIARTELQAIQLVPLVILPQIMLSGILLPVTGDGASRMAAALSKPVLLRWGYGALLQVEYAVGTDRGARTREAIVSFWKRVGFEDDVLAANLGVMVAIGVVCAVASWVVLLRRDRR